MWKRVCLFIVFLCVILFVSYIILRYSSYNSDFIDFVSTILGAVFAIGGGYFAQVFHEEHLNKKDYKDSALRLYINTCRILKLSVLDIVQGRNSGESIYSYYIPEDWIDNMNKLYGKVLDTEDYETMIEIYNEVIYIQSNKGFKQILKTNYRVYHERLVASLMYTLNTKEIIEENNGSVRALLSDRCNFTMDKLKKICGSTYDY